MSDKTRELAKEVYQRMCEYVGEKHEENCVEFLNFTFSSMEVEILNGQDKIQALTKHTEVLTAALEEIVECEKVKIGVPFSDLRVLMIVYKALLPPEPEGD